MQVDSYRFLPRSFRAMYESPAKLEEGEIWAPFEKRLASARLALLTSAGLHVEGEQDPFDAEGERRNPMWGDPTYRLIPHVEDRIGMTHLHVNSVDVLADPEIALPRRTLDTLVAEGRVGGTAERHVSVMGFQEAGLEAWRETTAPAIIEHLRAETVDGVVLAPV